MAKLGEGPSKSGDVAEMMKEPPTKLGPLRASIIKKDDLQPFICRHSFHGSIVRRLLTAKLDRF